MLSFRKPKVILGNELLLVLSVGKHADVHTLQIILSCSCTDSIHLKCVMLSLHILLMLALKQL